MNIRPVICVPIYRSSFTEDELVSLDCINRQLGQYDCIILAPDCLDINSNNLYKAKILRFKSYHFQSNVTYSHLLLTKSFYSQFKEYSHVLIYQPDCLVFKDELLFWCNSSWDYIGSPWFRGIDKSDDGNGLFASGNGGFSLRRVSKFLSVLNRPTTRLKKKSEKCWGIIPPNPEGIESRRGDLEKVPFACRILALLKSEFKVEGQARNYRFHEDMFWSMEALRFDSSFKVAPADVALRFGFERHPRECFKMTGETMPFGCHAWNKYDRKFWESRINAQN